MARSADASRTRSAASGSTPPAARPSSRSSPRPARCSTRSRARRRRTSTAPSPPRRPRARTGASSRRPSAATSSSASRSSSSEHKPELTDLMTREMGKVQAEAGGDVQEAIDMSYYMGGEGRRLLRPDDAVRAPRQVHDERAHAGRRRRRDHAVELPDRDPGVEALPGARLRQHRRPEAGRGHAAARRRGSSSCSTRRACPRASSTSCTATARRRATRSSATPTCR